MFGCRLGPRNLAVETRPLILEHTASNWYWHILAPTALQDAPPIGKWNSCRLNFCAPMKQHTDPCRIHNCWLQVTDGHWWSLMVTDGHWWSLMVTDDHWWSLMVTACSPVTPPRMVSSWPKSAVHGSRSMALNLPLQAVQVAASAREDVWKIDENRGLCA